VAKMPRSSTDRASGEVTADHEIRRKLCLAWDRFARRSGRTRPFCLTAS